MLLYWKFGTDWVAIGEWEDMTLLVGPVFNIRYNVHTALEQIITIGKLLYCIGMHSGNDVLPLSIMDEAAL